MQQYICYFNLLFWQQKRHTEFIEERWLCYLFRTILSVIISQIIMH